MPCYIGCPASCSASCSASYSASQSRGRGGAYYLAARAGGRDNLLTCGGSKGHEITRRAQAEKLCLRFVRDITI